MTLTATLDVEHRAEAGVEAVWAVLSDGWLYASWVVGASRVRAVDRTWPEPGSALHHSFGVWPLVINDRTEVLDCEPHRRLLLRPRGWPTGEAEVEIRLTPMSAAACVLHIKEDVVAGPARVIPKLVRQAATLPRNRETLRRLALVAHGRQVG